MSNSLPMRLVRCGWIVRKWRVFLAYYRLDLKEVCRQSQGRGLYDDFHDYPDDPDGAPLHFVTLRCCRCQKLFCI